VRIAINSMSNRKKEMTIFSICQKLKSGCMEMETMKITLFILIKEKALIKISRNIEASRLQIRKDKKL